MGKYLDKIRQYERIQAEECLRKQKMADQAPTVQLGDRITWTHADGSHHAGFVDFLHADSDGKSWAFVTQGSEWSAVNMRYVVSVDVIGPR